MFFLFVCLFVVVVFVDVVVVVVVVVFKKQKIIDLKKASWPKFCNIIS